MLPTLPLDANNKQIRIGDHVAYSAADSCHMFLGRVVKMTPCWVWMVPIGFEDSYKFKHRREYRQVIIFND